MKTGSERQAWHDNLLGALRSVPCGTGVIPWRPLPVPGGGASHGRRSCGPGALPSGGRGPGRQGGRWLPIGAAAAGVHRRPPERTASRKGESSIMALEQYRNPGCSRSGRRRGGRHRRSPRRCGSGVPACRRGGSLQSPPGCAKECPCCPPHTKTGSKAFKAFESANRTGVSRKGSRLKSVSY